jgi:IS4 transposase
MGNEYKGLTCMVDRSCITDKVIITLDRGYECYNNMAHIEQKGWWYVIRVKDVLSSSGILSGLNLPNEGEFDIPVSFTLTRKQTNVVKAGPGLYKNLSKKATFDYCDLHDNKFYPVSFRVVRVMLPNGEYESLITNLPAHEFSPDELREIYKRRWGIETSFRELKHLIGMANFHSKKREFIVQEIFARLVMYNFVSIITVAVTVPTSGKKHD